MRIENTNISNYYYVIDNEKVVGIKIDPGKYYEKEYYLGDVVRVSDDGRGYIGHGITTPGIGKIVAIQKHDTDHFFTVEMENGEIGYAIKRNRLEVIRRLVFVSNA